MPANAPQFMKKQNTSGYEHCSMKGIVGSACSSLPKSKQITNKFRIITKQTNLG